MTTWGRVLARLQDSGATNEQKMQVPLRTRKCDTRKGGKKIWVFLPSEAQRSPTPRSCASPRDRGVVFLLALPYTAPMSYAYTQPLRGLGAPTAPSTRYSGLVADVQNGLNDLVNRCRSETQKIVNKYKGSWTEIVRRPQDIWFTGEKQNPVENWAANINATAEQMRANLSRPDAQGVPFFARFPQDARRLVLTAKASLEEMIDELEGLVEAGTFKGTIQTILDFVLATLLQLAEMVTTAVASAVAKFPIGAIAVAGVLGIGVFAYLKIMRVI